MEMLGISVSDLFDDESRLELPHIIIVNISVNNAVSYVVEWIKSVWNYHSSSFKVKEI